MSHYVEEPVALGVSACPESTEIQLVGANVIMVFGCTGTGKTSFANIASGSEMEVGKGLRSSTKHLEASKIFQVDNQSVAIVDCPGFNDTYLTETEILRRLAKFLTNAYANKYKIIGFLYFHKISDTRVGGASFLHMKLFKALCGTDALKNAIYVTNMWSDPPTEDEMLREVELRETDKFFGEGLAEGAQISRHYNTRESAHEIIRKLLGKEPVITKLQRQLVDDKRPLEETDAGLVIGEDLEDDLRKQQQEMDELKEEKEKALESNNQNWLRRLEAQEERTRAKEQRLAEQLRALKASKPKQVETTIQSPQVNRDQGRVVVPDLSSQFREQMEAKMNELTQKSSRQNRPVEPYLPSQEEWDKQRNDDLAREINRIQVESAYSRGHAASRGPFDVLMDLGSAFVSTFARNPVRNRGTSSSTTTGSGYRPGAYPTAAHGPPMENVSDSFGSPHLTQSPGPHDTRDRHAQASSSSRRRWSDGSRSTHDERVAGTSNSRQRSHGHESIRAPERRGPPPGHKH